MAQTVEYQGVPGLRPKAGENWLRSLSDQSRNACVGLMSRLLNSKSLRCLVLRECTEETHYKGRTIETTVFSDGHWSWHAQHTVWPTVDRTGEGKSIMTLGLSAHNEVEALALAIEELREMIDRTLIEHELHLETWRVRRNIPTLYKLPSGRFEHRNED
ncbi:MAG: hypothetical protein QM706_06195 [Nitrospira sp.]